MANTLAYYHKEYTCALQAMLPLLSSTTQLTLTGVSPIGQNTMVGFTLAH
jgi:hypothetical protein